MGRWRTAEMTVRDKECCCEWKTGRKRETDGKRRKKGD
jgi:hypothetical protein